MMAVRKYSEEKAEEKKEQVYADEEANKFSKLAFGGWDMKLFDASSVEDAKIQASENMHMALKEQDILDKIANRSKKEKQIRAGKQGLGVFINLILIGFSWFVIGYLTYLSGQATSFFSDKDSFFGKVHTAIPMTNLALTVINGVLPAITNALIEFEKWDSLTRQFQMETGRLYFGKILNALVLMYTGANSFVGGRQLEIPGLTTLWGEAQTLPNCGYGTNSDATYGSKVDDAQAGWPCPEDELGFLLFKTIALDFFVGKAVGVAIGEAKKVWVVRIMKQPASAARSDFQTSTNVIQLLYTQAIAWLAVPYFPAILFWMPLMWYSNFKWDFWFLCRYMKKPLRTFEARKAQAFIASFFVVSLAIALLNLYFFMSKETCGTVSASCTAAVQAGPFSGQTALTTPNSTPRSPNGAFIPQKGALSSLLNMAGSPIFVYALVVVYVTKYVLEKKHRTVTNDYSKTKQVDLQEQLQQLSRQMAKKDQKIAFFEKARAKRDK